MYTDNQRKFIAVLNLKIEMPKLMNALGHATAGLVAKAHNPSDMEFLEYEFHANFIAPSQISLYPFIILKAKNNNQLKNLHQSVNEAGILHSIFTDTMLGYSANEQREKTRSTPIDSLTYFTVVLFGSTDKLSELTRKFSLFNGIDN